MSLHFSAPHWPWEAPGDTAESARIGRMPRGLFHLDGGSQATYRRMIEAMDRQIGRVLGALEAGRLTDNTIVIFTSDNGGERFSDTWPFSGRKTELLEGGLRIPTIISWPARLPRGRTTDQVGITMDWLPTLLAAAGATPDPRYPPDGMDLLPILTGRAPNVPRKLYWRYKARAQRAMRDGNLKFLKILDHTFLFDVVADPLERANLKERRKDDYRRLVRQWLAWNATMLPEVEESFTHSFSGDDMADRYGVEEADQRPELPTPADTAEGTAPVSR
jgi:arylsulfatase A-like enzyme